jgi:nicotinate-nucleotide pyrophosphorylase (carboxylating)
MAIHEDIPNGDITTDPLGAEGVRGRAVLKAKQDLVLSGVEAFTETFKQIDSSSRVQWTKKDGDFIKNGTVICTIDGSLPSLLKSERTALNFLGHLSGVATLTAKFVEKTKGTQTRIMDTRKTTPGLRQLEKNAVRHGGGHNHRFCLSDAILIKENHIRTAGGITAAVESIREAHPKTFIEVEVTNMDEIKEALNSKVDRVLLDNMSNEEISKAVNFIAKKCSIEASGNMTLDRIQSVATLGVDFISVGLLTHSAPVADVSLLFE